MLALNPSLAALHTSRLDHASAVAHGLITAAEHLASSTLHLQNQVLGRVAERLRTHEPRPPVMLAIELGCDPEVQRMGAAVFQEQVHLAADVGTRWIAYGEWHQHGMNNLLCHWLARIDAALSSLPQLTGSDSQQPAVASTDTATATDAEVVSDSTVVSDVRGRRRK